MTTLTRKKAIILTFVGEHELRLAEPGLACLRLSGDLSRSEAREILEVMREHLTNRDARILVDVTQHRSLPPDLRQEFDALRRELDTPDCKARHIAFFGAHMLHKVALTPFIARNGVDAEARLLLYFFQNQAEALDWLKLPQEALFSPENTIFLTHFC